MRRVVIRGVGVCSPLGATWPETAAALAMGASAVTPVTAWDVTGFPCQVAAAITTEPAPRAGASAGCAFSGCFVAPAWPALAAAAAIGDDAALTDSLL